MNALILHRLASSAKEDSTPKVRTVHRVMNPAIAAHALTELTAVKLVTSESWKCLCNDILRGDRVICRKLSELHPKSHA
jgi:hypothetical protein